MPYEQSEHDIAGHAQTRKHVHDYVVSVARALAEYAEQGHHIVIESEREDSLVITLRLDKPEAYHDLLSTHLGAALGVLECGSPNAGDGRLVAAEFDLPKDEPSEPGGRRPAR